MPSKIDRKGYLLLLLYSKGQGEEYCEPIKGRTRLAKLLFLLKEEKWGFNGIGKLARDYYKFKPDKFGPFDSTVFNDLDFLRAIDFILVRNTKLLPKDGINEYIEALKDWAFNTNLSDEITESDDIFEHLDDKYFEQEISLTERGKNFVKDILLKELKKEEQLDAFYFVKSKYGSWRLSKLLRYIYLNYPKMADNSEIRNKILKSS